MVQLRPEDNATGPIITGFTQQGFKIGDRRFEGGLLLSPEQAIDWTASTLSDLAFADILTALNLGSKPEFLLLGSGANMQQPPAAFRREVEAEGIGLEVMDSRAAAKTWGVLRAEERWLIGALMPLSA